MAVFHVNPETGEPGKCSALAGNCPFGGDDEHFASLEAAKTQSEELLSSQFLDKGFKKTRVQVSRETVEELVEELHEAADAYYQRGEESKLTDEEFDAKLDYLQQIYDSGRFDELLAEGSKGFNLLENDPALGTSVDSDETIEHIIPMLSLAKAKKEPDLYAFLNKARNAGAKGFRLQAKLDGLAMAVEYRGGKIATISTRGDGVHGEDITYLTKDPNVKLVGLELSISDLGNVEVRGELFFTNAQFKSVDDSRFAKTGVRFKNSRNSATGLVKAAKQGVEYPVEFTFAAYSVIKDNTPADMALLKELEFRSVDELTDEATPGLELSGFASNEEVMKAIHDFGEIREGFDFPTDGVVIKPTNEAEMLAAMGYTSHHPASQIAWKYPDETATTVVLAIDTTVGASGKLTPIARVTPVELAGSTVKNASLHNFNLIESKGIRVGSTVLIEKANEIIPQLKAVLSNPKDSVPMKAPKNCPSCSTALVFDPKETEWPPKTLRCPNIDCDSRKFFSLKMAVGKQYMDIDGLSEVSLDYLNSIGRVTKISDLYTLELKELADSELGESQNGNARRLGEKRAQNILNHIEKSKTRPLSKMLPAVSIEGLGPSTAKALEKRFGDIDGILSASREEIARIPGFGEITAEKIATGLEQRSELIAEMRSHGVTFSAGEKKTVSGSTSVDLTGKSFAISGTVPPGFRNRGEWVDYIEALGGEFHSSPKAHTTYMIGDPNENSSKINAAKKHKLTFMSAQGFTSQFKA